MADVKIYTTSMCPYCIMVKDFLKEHNINFTEINVGLDREKAEEMIKKSGQIGVPVIEIDGKIIVGFDKKRISELLGI
jgi:glutaredoxin-like YruB-family protein